MYKFSLVLIQILSLHGIRCERREINNIEYYPSSGLNLIMSVPHGGVREPRGIPNRGSGCWDSEQAKCHWTNNCRTKNPRKCGAVIESDVFTIDLALKVRANVCHIFRGLCPAAVVNLLSRKKLDGNRDLEEATFLETGAIDAFFTYHQFISLEINKINSRIGGLLIDIHGHSHRKHRAEFGYLPKGQEFDEDIWTVLNKSSIRNLASTFSNDSSKLERIFRGSESLGGLLEKYGYAAVPSPINPTPGNDTYFNGGYITLRYGSKVSGFVDAVQIESCRSVREPDNISGYSCALSLSIKDFLCIHYYSKDDRHLNDAIKRACESPSSTNECVSTESNDAE